MGKKRKTRIEKVRASAKIRLIRTQESSMPVYSFGEISQEKVTPLLRPRIKPLGKSSSYTYVISDIRQTIIITSTLLAVGVILNFLIRNQIVKLTMFGY